MKDHRALLEALEDMAERGHDQSDANGAELNVRELLNLEDSMMHHFTMFMTEQGWSGFGPEHIKEGDILINVAGLPTVFVLRQEDTVGEYILIGQADVIAHAGDHGLALAMSREQQDFVVC